MKAPETSREAKELKTDESKVRDYDRIASALLVIGKGHYEEIANALHIKDFNVVSRRLKEMRELGLLENTGEKKLTSRLRNAYVHQLTELGKSKKPIVVPPKEKPQSTDTITVREHKRRLKKEPPRSNSPIQQKLL